MIESLRASGRADEQECAVPLKIVAPGSLDSRRLCNQCGLDTQRDKAARIVCEAKTIRNPPLDDLPTDQREGYPSGLGRVIP